ncbi:MAG: YidC/Oxa1 family membrane protein insertase, partial [Lachnospiraceae bacterium]|nr:YidC/Oxa1 family membrane protein insertase [Lachnospiraceae bacterium]
MNSLFLLTQSANSFLRPIARVLGWIMNGIYNFMDSFLNIQNVALTIVIFTIIIYIIMLPLTYQQQKFSKLSQIMQPEIQAVQKKYRGKKDSISMQRQNEETQEIYRKYGVRPSGSCVFMVIQFLILIPLYRVIYSVPGYVTRVRETFDGLVTSIMNTPDYQNTMTAFLDTISENNSVMRQVSLNFTETSTDAYNSIIDVLYRCTSDNWHLLANTFSSLSDLVQSTQTAVEHFTSFLGASIVYAPMVLIRTSASSGHYGLIFIGILIPVISAATQFLSVRLMPQANTGQGDQMGNQMRMMNYFMPIYSFFIVFFLPIGIGIYWIAGAVIRIVQQFFINRHFDRIDMNALIEKNAQKTAEKEKKKVERKGVSGEQIRSAAGINTRQIPRSMSERAASVQMMDDNANSKASSKGGSSGKSSSGTGSSGKSSSGT